MAVMVELFNPSQWANESVSVRQLSTIPAWLAAALDADQVMAALNRHVPEFASGALTLRDCKIDLLHLKGTKGEWERNWVLTVADAVGGVTSGSCTGLFRRPLTRPLSLRRARGYRARLVPRFGGV